MRGASLAGPLALTLLVTACSGGSEEDAGSVAAPPPTEAPAGAPSLDVEVVAEGFDHPWDVAQAEDGTLLVDERAGGFTAVLPDGTVREVQADLGDLFATGETGLMGLALEPGFEENRRFYTCQGVTGGEGASIEVIAWAAADDWSAATRVEDPLIGGIPVNQGSGRHGGCRLAFGPDGALLVGTGDNAVGTTPQDLGTLAGKVLRADPATGEPLPDNPFAAPDDGAEDLIWTYGHRNVQGLAVRPGTDQTYSVEHGPDRNDEVNLLQPGGNYGWDPDGGGSYDESVPMTDPAIEGAVPAVWDSGAPPIAPSGGTFLDGDQWGDYDGLLLLGALRGQHVLALRLDDQGQVVEQFRLPELDGTHGRIRALEQGTDGALYVTTDNGDDRDQLLRVTPQG
ncbi:PQQ-dependent sugar dehydrogenase [Blastococcus sp. MG754426]|uniref:PQQ-dependent sugar dehydrogenase n=1 Tax=unclassified Blastococcus TaxID=2619396 RepID=UPI001EF0D705|nr:MULTISPECIES: PQQ-dependent sugar dehydrogenase [unclassified Blastococcus]MCF6507729.1 PQQ-dependent sugar dehydrogenase [Blastococcus sp. MG754426]MCF6512275.1 PQQ-dependent sugar dehydrogenase [Blastococcus sp. MG754427]